MHPIEAILFEPVGCLAEFPSEPFHEIAALVFGVSCKKASRSASRAYWHLLNLMEAGAGTSVESLELEAVEAANLYEDVDPALTELKALGTRLSITTSLSRAAVDRFLEKHHLARFFDSVWHQENSGGIKSVPLRSALRSAETAIFLADTLEAVKAARTAGVHPILMMNDPDEARRLTTHEPAGGIVSLHELPDFVRLLLTRDRHILIP
jgi:phosphoglycolate phosphatase-like HAD superfamily hydrolase